MQVGQAIRISSHNQLGNNMTAAVDGFLVYCQAKNLSENTLVYYRTRIEAFVRFLGQQAPGIAPKDVSRQLLREFVTEETSRTSPSTANHAVMALRAFFGFLVKDGYLESNPMEGVEKVRQSKKILNTFTPDQVESLLNQFGTSFTDVRDKALILLLFDCGLRASEVCSLSVDDLCWTEQTMRVLGKGSRERLVPFGQSVKQVLTQYLLRRGQLETNALFVNCYGESVDRHRIGKIVQRRCEKAGITGVRCSPHTLRHTFAVTYLRGGGDLFSLQKILGHSDLTMTRRYTELSESDVIKRHRTFSPADRLQPMKRMEGRKRIV